jgi:hypothetical protein
MNKITQVNVLTAKKSLIKKAEQKYFDLPFQLI